MPDTKLQGAARCWVIPGQAGSPGSWKLISFPPGLSPQCRTANAFSQLHGLTNSRSSHDLLQAPHSFSENKTNQNSYVGTLVPVLG